MGKVMYMRKGETRTVPVGVPIGTIWLFTSNGTFEAPIDGKYSLELHGGGGGGGGGYLAYADSEAIAEGYKDSYAGGGGGGGSGELFETTYTKGATISIKIGAGGKGGGSPTFWLIDSYCSGMNEKGTDGGTTTAGVFSVAGGKGGGKSSEYEYSYGNATVGSGGAGSGSLATSGANGIKQESYYGTFAAGGQGNKNNKSQTYGDGGSGGGPQGKAGTAGQPGAVIITYLGKE